MALIQAGHIELGCVILPDLNEIYLSYRGGGVTLNGDSLGPIAKGPVRPEELVCYNDWIPRSLNGMKIPGKRRDFGAFVVSGAFVSTQRVRGLVAMNEKLYDIAPCVLFATELGAEVVYADGTPFVVQNLITDSKINKPWLIFPSESGFRI
jgi:fructose-1,6-bisphosphatase/inositol monophosphatase family enzyme